MKRKNNKIWPPLPPHSSIPSRSQTADLAHSSLHSFVFQTTDSLCFPLSFILFHFIFYFLGGGRSIFGNVFLHCLYCYSPPTPPPSFCLSSLLLCPRSPFHLDSWSVRGVTGVSRLSPSLSQLVDLCLRNDSTHSSSLPARIDKIAWQQKLLLMCCDRATLSAPSQLPLSRSATKLRLGCECACVWASSYLCVGL